MSISMAAIGGGHMVDMVRISLVGLIGGGSWSQTFNRMGEVRVFSWEFLGKESGEFVILDRFAVISL